jgi:hypothetical protein
MAYDSSRDRVVKVGRFGETAEWDGMRWSLRSEGPVPYSMYGSYSVAYHEGINRTVWLDTPGCGGGRTFLWDGSQWVQNTSSPQPSWSPKMAYDRRAGHLVAWGGLAPLPGGGCQFDERTWLFNGQQWTSIATPGPGNRRYPCLGYDESLEAVVLFGGDRFISIDSDSWKWNGAAWERLLTTGGASPRYFADLVYDRARQRLVLFSGISQPGGPPNQETWTLLRRYVTATPSAPPPGQTVVVSWTAPGEANRFYALGASLGRVPGLPVGDGRIVPLNPDAMFLWSFLSQTPPFVGFAGRLSASGTATATVQIPLDSRLSGVRFFVAGATIAGSGLARVSNEESIRIR